MYTQVTETDFINAFQAIRPDNFSLEGLRELFAYFEELESMTDQPIELDVIAICCEWSEKTFEELEFGYGHLIQTSKDSEDYQHDLIDAIEMETVVIGLENDSYLIIDF